MAPSTIEGNAPKKSTTKPPKAPSAFPTEEEIQRRRKEILSDAKAEREAITQNTKKKLAELKKEGRKAERERARNQRTRDTHAKVLVGVALIYQCQQSAASATKFKGFLEGFYSDAPERLKNALYGLTLTVKKPSSDAEQD